MGAAMVDSDPTTSMPLLRVFGVLGLLLAVGVLIFVGFAAPDDGVSSTSLQQAFALALVTAAVPLAILFGHPDPARVVSLGGAMTIAGLATIAGVNFVGLLMSILGFALMLVGASRTPALSLGIAARLIVYTVLLGVAAALPLGDTTTFLVLLSLGLAAIVATSSLWDPPSPTAS